MRMMKFGIGNDCVSRRAVDLFYSLVYWIFFACFFLAISGHAHTRVEPGLQSLLQSEFLGTLIGVKPISMMSFSLPRDAELDQDIQASLNHPEVQMALHRQGIQTQRIVKRPEWNPSIEVVYYLIVNKSAINVTLRDSEKVNFLNQLGFAAEESSEVVIEKIVQMVEAWNPTQTAKEAHGILGVFLGYPVLAIETFLESKSSAERSKKSAYKFYEGPQNQFDLGAFTTTRISEDFQMQTKMLQAKSSLAVEKIVSDRVRGRSSLEILIGWNNQSLFKKTVFCKNLF